MEHVQRDVVARIRGVPNLTFDLVSMLHEKLEAISVYEGYLEDARAVGNDEAASVILTCQNADRTAVHAIQELLREELAPGRDNGQLATYPNRGGDLRAADRDNPIDDASDDSFPASDPPSFAGASIG